MNTVAGPCSAGSPRDGRPPAGGGMSGPAGRVAVVFRGDAGPGHAPAPSPRLAPVFSALAGRGLAAEPVPYPGIRAELVRDRLLAMDGVLAWVDPVTVDGDRTILD